MDFDYVIPTPNIGPPIDCNEVEVVIFYIIIFIFVSFLYSIFYFLNRKRFRYAYWGYIFIVFIFTLFWLYERLGFIRFCFINDILNSYNINL